MAARRDSPDTTHGTTREERLDRVVADYLKAIDSGQSPDRRQLLLDHPDLAVDLEQFFAGLDEAGRLEAHARRASFRLPARRQFGDYDLVEEIAHGGMGVVYKAKHRDTQQIVALKLVLGGQLAPRETVERFLREARAGVCLKHPNIVPVYDTGELDGWHFLSMRLIEGANLATAVKRLRGDFRAASRILEKVARAIHHAHERGIVHRDLKPGNILLDKHGEPHVTDFGLAGLLDTAGSLTGSGDVLGTLKYMAPEQASGKTREIKAAADVYSLGVILYELLVGHPPFQGESSVETLRQVIHCEPVRPTLLRRDVPRDLETICLKCLEKAPRRRYSTAADVATDLRRWHDRMPILAPSLGPLPRAVKWAQGRPAIATLVLGSLIVFPVLAVLALLYYGELKGSAELNRDRAADAVAESAARNRIIRHYTYAEACRLAYDAWKNAYCDRAAALLDGIRPRDGSDDLRGFEWYYLQGKLSGAEHTYYVGRGRAAVIALRNDGELLAAGGNDDTVRFWNTRTGEFEGEVVLPSTARICSLAFSPEGDLLAVGTGTGRLILVGGRNAAVIRDLGEVHDGALEALSFAPGRNILASGGADGRVLIRERSTWQRLRSLDGHFEAIHSLDVSDGGLLVAASKCSVELWDLDDLGEQPAIAGENLTCVAVSPDGKLVAMAGKDGVCFLRDAGTGVSRNTLVGHKEAVLAMAFSADSRFLATASADRTVRIWDVSGQSEPRCLRGHSAPVHAVEFSADGRSLVTAGARGFVKVWDPDLPEEPRNLSGHDDTVWHTAFRADGRTFVSASEDYTLRVWEMGGRGPEVVIHQRSVYHKPNVAAYGKGQVSSNGERFAVASNEGVVEVWSIGRREDGYRLRDEGRLKGHEGRITGLNFSADASTLVTSCRKKQAILWQRTTQGDDVRWTRHAAFSTPFVVWDTAFSADGAILALAEYGADGRLALRDLESGTMGILEAHAADIRTVAIAADSSFLATGGGDNTVKVWKLSRRPEGVSAELWTTLYAHDDRVTAAVFSADSRTLLTGGDDGVVNVWDLFSSPESRLGICRATLDGFSMPVKTLSLSPDGRTLVAGGGISGEAGELKVLLGAR